MMTARPPRIGERFRCLKCKRSITISAPGPAKKTRLAAPPQPPGPRVLGTLVCTACGAKMACTRRLPPPGASVKCVRCAKVFRVPTKQTILAAPPKPKPQPPPRPKQTRLNPAKGRPTKLATAPVKTTKLAPPPAPKKAPAPAPKPSPRKRSRLYVAGVGLLGGIVVSVTIFAAFLIYQRFGRGELPDSAWLEFTPPDGRCRLLFPGQAHEQPATMHAPGLSNAVNTVYSIEREAMLRSVKGSLMEEKDITLDGHPGKEFHGSLPGESRLLVRVYAVGERIYILGVGGPGLRPDRGTAAKFLRSFRVGK